MPSFSLYLIALFCSPLYFLLRRRWGGFAFNLLLYLSAVVLVWVFFIGVIPWMLGVTHAAWHIHGEIMERHMEKHAALIAERLNKA
jgi:hypothetical protein